MANINLNAPSKFLLRPVNPRGSNKPLPLKDCCKVQRNLVVLWLQEDLRIIHCQVCNHKYWRLWAEPGSLGAMRG
jgi:hypothetical protein